MQNVFDSAFWLYCATKCQIQGGFFSLWTWARLQYLPLISSYDADAPSFRRADFILPLFLTGSQLTAQNQHPKILMNKLFPISRHLVCENLAVPLADGPRGEIPDLCLFWRKRWFHPLLIDSNQPHHANITLSWSPHQWLIRWAAWGIEKYINI